MSKNILLDFFKKHEIKYRLFEHNRVFTCDDKLVVTAVDGKESNAPIPEPHFKTLFLKDKNGKFFLASVIDDKRVDLKALSDVLGCGRFSFGKADELLDLMTLTPGSVTPFGLIFDQQNKIEFVLDGDALTHTYVSFHPLKNDMTVVMTVQVFLTCMEKMGHQPRVIQIPVKQIAE